MLTLSFMRHAFVASTFIAIVSGFVGVFVVVGIVDGFGVF